MSNPLNHPTYGSYGFIRPKGTIPLPFELLDLGYERREKENYCFYNKERVDYCGYLFQYTLSGSGIYCDGEREVRLQKGDAFLIQFPCDSAYYLPSASEGYWEFIYLHFQGSGVDCLYKELTKKGTLLHLDPDRSSLLYFFQKLHELQQELRFAPFEDSSWLYTFLIHLYRDLETPDPLKKSPLVQQAQAYLEANYAQEMNLSHMASEIRVSLPHITREFHAQMGLTPIRYLIKLRIEHAIRLLLSTSYDIQDIAQQCGFQSSNYFAKVFRKEVGLSPSRYRILHH